MKNNTKKPTQRITTKTTAPRIGKVTGKTAKLQFVAGAVDVKNFRAYATKNGISFGMALHNLLAEV